MRSKCYILIIFFISLLIFIWYNFTDYLSPDFEKSGLNYEDFSENEAIKILKDKYTEFKNYPNDNLPPQSIKTEKATNGRYIAFVQEWSGRPILGAKCFFVDNNWKITKIWEFLPSMTEYDFSVKTCK